MKFEKNGRTAKMNFRGTVDANAYDSSRAILLF
jgi:hypothetical protein